MMPGPWSNKVRELGGRVDEFCQADKIATLHWDDPDPTRRAGAWGYGEGLENGVCMGLACLYVSQMGVWDNFTTEFNSASGLSMVRGAQNLTKELRRQDVYARSGRRLASERGWVTGKFVRAFGGPDSSGSISYWKSGGAGDHFVAVARQRMGLYYVGISYGRFGGKAHAMAFANRPLKVSFFDPNFGQATFSGPERYENLKDLVGWTFSRWYAHIQDCYILPFPTSWSLPD